MQLSLPDLEITVITFENLMCTNAIILSFSRLEKYLTLSHHPLLSKIFFLPLSILVEIVQTLKLARDTQIGHGDSARSLEPLQHTPNACRLRPWVREHREGIVGLPAGAGGPSGPCPHPAAHVSTLLEEEGALQRTVSPDMLPTTSDRGRRLR